MGLLVTVSVPDTALAQNGVSFQVYHWASPASMSIQEEATYSTVVPMMGVFNNQMQS